MIIKIIIAAVGLIRSLIIVIWSQNSNDCNNDHITIIGGYSNENKIIILNINDG